MAVDSQPRFFRLSADAPDQSLREERERMIRELEDNGYIAQEEDGTLALGPYADQDSIKKIDRKGKVTFSGKGGYDLGNSFSSRLHPEIEGMYAAIQFAGNIGGILEKGDNGERRVSHFFSLLTDEEYEQKKKELKRRENAGEIKNYSHVVSHGITLYPADVNQLPIKKIPTRSGATGLEKMDFPKEENYRRAYLFRFLEEHGYVQAIASNDGPRHVWDLEKLCDGNLSRVMQKGVRSPSIPKAVSLLRDVSGISQEDYAREGERAQSKKLFYYPHSRDEALDPQAIRKGVHEAHLTLFDLKTNIDDYSKRLALDDGSAIGLDELFITSALFGKMNAHRLQDGTLVAADESGREKKFSATRFSEMTHFSGRSRKAGEMIPNFASRPLKYIQRYCPELLTRPGLFRVEDFRDKSGEIARPPRPIDQTGGAMIKGARYSLGAEFGSRGKRVGAKERWYIAELTPELAGVLEKMDDGSFRVEKVFKLKSPGEIEERRKAADANYAARGRLLKGHETTARTFFNSGEIEWLDDHVLLGTKPLEGESPESFASRAKRVPDFTFLNGLTSALGVRAHVAIHKTLSLHEQFWLAAAAKEIPNGKERIVQLTTEFGLDFLKSFLSCEYGRDAGYDILALAEHGEKSSARDIFSRYASIVDAARTAHAYIVDTFHGVEDFTDESAERMQAKMLERGKALLHQTAKKLSSKKGIKEADIKRLLALYETDIILFTEAFKSIRERQQLSFEDIANVSLESVRGPDLTKDDRHFMRTLYESNYRTNAIPYSDSFIRELLDGFDWATQNQNTTFHILRHEGRIVAFRRFDRIGEHKYYTGSLNVDPAYAKAGIARLFMEYTAWPYVEHGATLECYFDIRQKLWAGRIEDGYIGVAYEPAHNGVPGLLARLSPDSATYNSKRTKDEKLLRDALEGTSDVVLRPADSADAFQPLADGYVLTRVIQDAGGGSSIIYEKKRDSREGAVVQEKTAA